MKIINLILALSAFALLASCYDDDNDNPKFPEGQVNFRSTIAGQVTYVENDVWHPNDAIGTFMLSTDFDLLEGNKHYVTPGNSTFSPKNPSDIIYYPNNDAVNFVAYYPYSTEMTHVYKLDVSNQTDQAKIDLLYSNNAFNKTKENKVIELNFLHQLSKIIFKIVPGEGLTQTDLNNLEVKIDGFNTKAEFYINGVIEDPGTPATIVTKTTTAGKIYESIVIPTTVEEITQVIFDLKNAEGDKFTWNVPINTEFEAGKKHTYTVTIKRTDISVIGTIEDWKDGTGGNVIAQ